MYQHQLSALSDLYRIIYDNDLQKYYVNNVPSKTKKIQKIDNLGYSLGNGYLENGSECILKVYHCDDPKDKQLILRELLLFLKIEHENSLKFIGIGINLVLVFSFVDARTLQYYLDNDDSRLCNVDFIKLICRQIESIINYLIKDNIMVSLCFNSFLLTKNKIILFDLGYHSQNQVRMKE
jgi:hypothetical protein